MDAKKSTLLILLLSMSCGTSSFDPKSVNTTDTQCTSLTAQIMVGDGFMKSLCGCTEAGVQVQANGHFTCHVPSTTKVVFFLYANTTLKHLIAPTNGSFVASPLSDPSQPNTYRQFPMTVQSSITTYTFQDEITGMTGTIYVN